MDVVSKGRRARRCEGANGETGGQLTFAPARQVKRALRGLEACIE
jgi:hypothetical protein